MSELLTALNQIYACLEKNYPNIAAKLPSGLSLKKIKQIFQNIPFQIPQEVYELYQYCGGWDWETDNWDTLFAPYYGTMTLCCPQGAIETAKDLEKYEVTYIGKPLIPIFGYDRISLCIVGNWQEKCPSPIVYLSELYEVELHYVSLTAMMQVTAQVWQTGAAYINREGLIECDEKKFFSIYKQSNSKLPQIALDRFNKELEIAGYNSFQLYKAWNNLENELYWFNQCFPDLSYSQFKPEIIHKIVRQINQKYESKYSADAKRILEKLKYPF